MGLLRRESNKVRIGRWGGVGAEGNWLKPDGRRPCVSWRHHEVAVAAVRHQFWTTLPNSSDIITHHRHHYFFLTSINVVSRSISPSAPPRTPRAVSQSCSLFVSLSHTRFMLIVIHPKFMCVRLNTDVTVICHRQSYCGRMTHPNYWIIRMTESIAAYVVRHTTYRGHENIANNESDSLTYVSYHTSFFTVHWASYFFPLLFVYSALLSHICVIFLSSNLSILTVLIVHFIQPWKNISSHWRLCNVLIVALLCFGYWMAVITNKFRNRRTHASIRTS